jgi:asparagine synthetase B (glutamine-hydrolysing)
LIRFGDHPVTKADAQISDEAYQKMADLLFDSVKKRIQSIPFSVEEKNDAVLVMFSGGLSRPHQREFRARILS